MNSTTKAKKEPVSVGAETSSKVSDDTNTTTVNNTPKNGICQEVDYKAKYMDCSSTLCYISTELAKVRQMLDDILSKYDFPDPAKEGVFNGAACMRTIHPSGAEMNGIIWLYEHDRLMTLVNIAADYTAEINRLLDESGEV